MNRELTIYNQPYTVPSTQVWRAWAIQGEDYFKSKVYHDIILL